MKGLMRAQQQQIMCFFKNGGGGGEDVNMTLKKLAMNKHGMNDVKNCT